MSRFDSKSSILLAALLIGFVISTPREGLTQTTTPDFEMWGEEADRLAMVFFATEGTLSAQEGLGSMLSYIDGARTLTSTEKEAFKTALRAVPENAEFYMEGVSGVIPAGATSSMPATLAAFYTYLENMGATRPTGDVDIEPWGNAEALYRWTKAEVDAVLATIPNTPENAEMRALADILLGPVSDEFPGDYARLTLFAQGALFSLHSQYWGPIVGLGSGGVRPANFAAALTSTKFGEFVRITSWPPSPLPSKGTEVIVFTSSPNSPFVGTVKKATNAELTVTIPASGGTPEQTLTFTASMFNTTSAVSAVAVAFVKGAAGGSGGGNITPEGAILVQYDGSGGVGGNADEVSFNGGSAGLMVSANVNSKVRIGGRFLLGASNHTGVFPWSTSVPEAKDRWTMEFNIGPVLTAQVAPKLELGWAANFNVMGAMAKEIGGVGGNGEFFAILSPHDRFGLSFGVRAGYKESPISGGANRDAVDRPTNISSAFIGTTIGIVVRPPAP